MTETFLKSIKWHEHANHLIGELIPFFTGAGGAVFGHWLSEKKNEKTGEVEKDSRGRTKMVLNQEKLEAEAPHYAKTLRHEAIFTLVHNELNDAEAKNVDPWLAGKGHHQRDDVVLTVAKVWAQEGLAAAAKTLRKLARVPDASDPANPNLPHPNRKVRWAAKDEHAIGAKLMRARETDYQGARIARSAGRILNLLVQTSQNGFVNWDAFAGHAERVLHRLDRMDRRRQQATLANTNRFTRAISWPFRTVREALHFNLFQN